MLLGGVFFLSLSSLFYEILLTRFFSIAQWNHLSFMVLSIALFGFAASGVFLNLLTLKKKEQIDVFSGKKWISRIIILFSVSVAGSYVIVNLIPIDYFRIPFEYLQIWYVLFSFILLSLPFFFSGLLSALAYSVYPGKAGIIYFISMTGSTLGAISPFPGIPVLDIGGSILVAALVPLFLLPASFTKMWKRAVWTLCIMCLVVLTFFIKDNPVIRVSLSPYKTLPQLLQLPASKVVKSYHIIQGKVDVVSSPYIRYVPGLSLKYTSGLPEQSALIKDADMQVTLYSIDPDNPPDIPAYTLPYAGYVLHESPENVLLLQKGGGTALPLSLFSGASHIILCEEHPVIAQYINEAYRSDRITVLNKSHREYISETRSLFDIIQIENWGSSIPGMASLSSEYLYTVEAMSGYIDILTDKGVLIISRKLLLPPSDSLRIFLSALTALKDKGFITPLKNIVMIKHWDIYTLLLSRTPFEGENLSRIKEFCAARGFDLLYYYGIIRSETERFVQSPEPYHYNEIQKLIKSNDPVQTASGYYLDIIPQKDERPYHNSYLKWGKLHEFFKSTGERFYTLILSGEIIVWVVLVVAFLVTLLILILPVILIPVGKENKSTSFKTKITYFLAIGAGFMFLEVAFIQEFTLLIGDPVTSFSFVLCLILVFSGIGGYFSSRVHVHTLRFLFIIMLSLLFILFISMNQLVHLLLKLPSIIRFIFMGMVMFPLSFLTGIPFPSGMRRILSGPAERAYSWAANGCTSVIASIISVPLSMAFGIHVLFTTGGICYGIAFIILILNREHGKN
ncbi:MAG: hypothetical protein JXB88_19780 [Spirochaetales bacterium]|nr:hypothetical protein [Spirochaetales bacterium]